LILNKWCIDITIELIEQGANKVRQKAADGEIDFGVVMMPVDIEEFDVIPFAAEELMLYMSASNPLAIQNGISLVDVKDEPMILFSEDFTLHDRIIQECKDAGFFPKVAYESSQWDFISDMVEHNLGITFFPESIMRKMNQETIRAVPITPAIHWHIGIILKKGRYMSFATKAFIEYLRSQSI
jgi:DNA-binding transcriptional LysR family regulator